MTLKFKSGTNIIVYGLTGTGKTTFIREVLKRRLVTEFPEKVFYFYKIRQPFMDTWNHKELEVEFVQGLELDKAAEGNCVVVVDDLLLESQKKTAELFVYGSHHLNITIFYLTQNLYPRDENVRIMTMNAHYMVLFGDQRSVRQVRSLSHQIFVGKERERLTNAFNKSINTNYGFVLLTFVQTFPRQLLVINNFWSNEPSVYL